MPGEGHGAVKRWSSKGGLYLRSLEVLRWTVGNKGQPDLQPTREEGGPIAERGGGGVTQAGLLGTVRAAVLAKRKAVSGWPSRPLKPP